MDHQEVKYPEIEVQLSNRDGNAYYVIGDVARAIRQVYGDEAKKAYVMEAMACDSYDALLRHAMRTVTVS